MATRYMSAGRIKPIVDRTGAESSAYQFVREGFKNAEEAKATRVHIGFELGATRQGIYRFMMVDDGCSMNRHELPSFVNKFGGGGKPIGGPHENFGVGLKSSTLPWNHHGVLIVARKERETNLIQLHLDPKADEYGLREWNTEDEAGNPALVDVLPIASLGPTGWEAAIDQDFEPVRGTRVRDLLGAFISDQQGTIVILCGDTGQENTYLAEGAGGELGKGALSGIATFLSRRFHRIPLAVSVVEPRTSNTQEWPTSPDDYHATILSAVTGKWKTKLRNPIGVGDFLANGGERGSKRPESKGSATFPDGTTAQWFLLPRGEKHDAKGAGGVYWSPTIAVLYDGEVYAWGSSQAERFRQFGINRREVIERCSIVLEPPRNNGGPGVYPDSSRSRLLWTGGRDLPWGEWARHFQSNMPLELELALQEATANLTRLESSEELSDAQRKRLNAVTRRIRSAWRRLWRSSDAPSSREVVRVRSIGNVGPTTRDRPEGGGEGGGGGGSGNRTSRSGNEERFVEDENGEERETVRSPRPDALPEIEWLPATEFEVPHFIARWSEASYKIEGNRDCPIIRDSIDYWTSEHPGVAQEDIAPVVMKVYGLKLRTATAHIMTAHRRGHITAADLQQALSPIAFTVASAGFIIEDAVMAGDIGALDGRQRKRNAASGGSKQSAGE